MSRLWLIPAAFAGKDFTCTPSAGNRRNFSLTCSKRRDVEITWMKNKQADGLGKQNKIPTASPVHHLRSCSMTTPSTEQLCDAAPEKVEVPQKLAQWDLEELFRKWTPSDLVKQQMPRHKSCHQSCKNARCRSRQWRGMASSDCQILRNTLLSTVINYNMRHFRRKCHIRRGSFLWKPNYGKRL